MVYTYVATGSSAEPCLLRVMGLMVALVGGRQQEKSRVCEVISTAPQFCRPVISPGTFSSSATSTCSVQRKSPQEPDDTGTPESLITVHETHGDGDSCEPQAISLRISLGGCDASLKAEGFMNRHGAHSHRRKVSGLQDHNGSDPIAATLPWSL
jgi:hypothetical protein